MPRRGAGRVWMRLPNEPIATMPDAKAMLKLFDLGSNALWKWPSSGSGDGITAAVRQCNAHVTCGFHVRCVRQSNGTYAFEKSGEHSSEVNDRLRQNSALTHAQSEFAFGAFMGTGAKPAEVRVGLTKTKEKELEKKGIDPLSVKDAEGGLEGECPAAVLLCASSLRCRHVLPRLCLVFPIIQWVFTFVLCCLVIGNVL